MLCNHCRWQARHEMHALDGCRVRLCHHQARLPWPQTGVCLAPIVASLTVYIAREIFVFLDIGRLVDTCTSSHCSCPSEHARVKNLDSQQRLPRGSFHGIATERMPHDRRPRLRGNSLEWSAGVGSRADARRVKRSGWAGAEE
eukprot:365041-Chlamydomonas_euryale.AAC.10